MVKLSSLVTSLCLIDPTAVIGNLGCAGQLDPAAVNSVVDDAARRRANARVSATDASALPVPNVPHLVARCGHDVLGARAPGMSDDARRTAEIPVDNSVRAARLRAMKADIVTSLDRSELSVEMLAARHRVTPRYVQILFNGEGTTFTEFVRSQRLALAHRMLIDPHLADRSITSVAFDVGFNDLSYFNRLFRRRFGCSPSQLRRAARGPDMQGSRFARNDHLETIRAAPTAWNHATTRRPSTSLLDQLQ